MTERILVIATYDEVQVLASHTLITHDNYMFMATFNALIKGILHLHEHEYSAATHLSLKRHPGASIRSHWTDRSVEP